MKTTITLLALATTPVFGRHLKGRCRSGYTTFTATFDEREPLANEFEGEFLMDICNSGRVANYDIDVKGDFGDTKLLNYHLHSWYNRNAEAGEIGSLGTSGHYDPTFRCGKASSNSDDTVRCETDYPNSGYELGDLSGRNEKLKVRTRNGIKKINTKVRDRTYNDDKNDVPLASDWSISGQQAGALFSSVVFHACLPDDPSSCSARLFGARLIKNCDANVFKAVLDGTGINKGVKGEFIMSICKDGSFAVYEGSFEGIQTSATGLNYHLHSAYLSDDEIGSSGTGGHYDPLFKCGDASSYKDSALCEGDYPNNGYELGDLSGKNGKIKVIDNDGVKSAAFRIVDKDPPRVNDYSETGRIDFGDTFSSIIFHCVSDTDCKARVFGAQLQKCRVKNNGRLDCD